jgi:hypothetical protein
MSILTNCRETATNHNSLGLGASKCNCHEIAGPNHRPGRRALTSWRWEEKRAVFLADAQVVLEKQVVER